MTNSFFDNGSPAFISTPLQNMILEMTGADTSFVKQICYALQASQDPSLDAKQSPLIQLINQLLNQSQSDLKTRWTGQLHSFSNQQVFQAIAELVSTGHLMQTGWKTVNWNGDTIELQHPSKGTIQLLTLSFLLQRDPILESTLQKELIQALNGLNSPHQIAITLRNPLQSHSNLGKIQQVLSHWLNEVDPDNTQTHSGFYADGYGRIDCRYLGPRGDQPTVAFCLPPLTGRKLHHIISNSAGKAVERVRRQLSSDVPLLVSIVTNHPTQISPAGWQFLLYGLKRSQMNQQITIDNNQFQGWFQDPFRTQVTGIMTLEQRAKPILGEPCFMPMVHCNPWSEFTSIHEALPAPRFMIDKSENCWDLVSST